MSARPTPDELVAEERAFLVQVGLDPAAFYRTTAAWREYRDAHSEDPYGETGGTVRSRFLSSFIFFLWTWERLHGRASPLEGQPDPSIADPVPGRTQQ